MSNVQFGIAQNLLTNEPDKTYNNCATALGNSTLTPGVRAKWENLKKQAEVAISERRKTHPNFASDIVLLEPVPINQRSTETPKFLSNTHKAPLSSPEKEKYDIKSHFTMYQNLLIKDDLDEVLLQRQVLHCQAELTLLDPEKSVLPLDLFDSEYSKIESSENKDLQKEIRSMLELLWSLLKIYCHYKALYLKKQQLNTLVQTLEILSKLREPQNYINLCMGNNSIKLSSTIEELLLEIFRRDTLLEHLPRLDQAIKDKKKIIDFLNQPPQKGINWDRFANIESDTAVLLKTINRKFFPNLYMKVLKGYKELESQAKYLFIYSISSTIVLALGIAFELYRQHFVPEIYIAAPIFTFMYGLLISIGLCKVSIQIQNEYFIEDFKVYLNWLNNKIN